MDRRDETVRKAKLLPKKPLLRAVGYALLFRFDHSTFYKNRARLMQHEVTELFFGQVVAQAQQAV